MSDGVDGRIAELREALGSALAALAAEALKPVAQQLAEGPADERVVVAAYGILNSGLRSVQGIVCGTDRRLLISGGRAFLRTQHDFAYDRINSIDLLPGPVILPAPKLVVNAGGATLIVRAFRARVPNRVAVSALQEAVALYSAPASSRSVAGEDVFASIERLARLRDNGAITQAEFERKKTEFLGRL